MERTMKKVFGFILVLFITAAALLGGLFCFNGWKSAEKLEQATPIQSLCEKVMAREDFVPYDQISPDLLTATICVEDGRYYSHGAVDLLSLIRAVISQLLPFAQKSGGSTITQQVVKNLYQQYDKGIEWKSTEIFQAFRLENLYTKDEILALYVNIINYGDEYIGIKEACQGYFECEPSQLNVEEATLLAGIPQSPSSFQLSDHFDAAKLKQKVVLNAMVRNRKISQEEADEIYQRPIHYIANGYWQDGIALLPLSFLQTTVHFFTRVRAA
ncbi:MAG: transglycosylase domain-containing protein [Ileibacterium sp.]|nr:transglycosylase domain-containing protein [Ileibacterium sp.]